MASPELAVSVLEAFKEHDAEHTGLISRDGLKGVLQSLDKDHWTDAAVEELFAAAGVVGDDGIGYEDFVSRVFADAAPAGADRAVPRHVAKQLASLRDKIGGLGGGGAEAAAAMERLAARIEAHAAVHGQGVRNRMANPHHIREAFDCYDADGSGYLEIGELASLAKELGLGMDRSEVHRALESIDTAGDGRISFQEFKAFMKASGATGSISQRLRMRIYNRKFDKAAKALGRANERVSHGEVKAEAGEDGEMVLSVGEPIDGAPLWARAQVSFCFAERGGDAEGSSSHTYQLKLRLAPPLGLSAQAVQANAFLQELQAGPPPGWQTAEVKGLDGGDDVEVTLGVVLDPQCDFAQNLEQVLGVASSGDAKVNVDLGSMLDIKALAQATAENPYDVASNAHFGARASFHVGDDSLLDIFAMLSLMQKWNAPDLDTPEEEWDEEHRFMKHVVPAFGKWLLKARGTVQFGSLEPLLGALSECRGHGEKHQVCSYRHDFHQMDIDKVFPDLHKVTAADIKQALAYLTCLQGQKIRDDFHKKEDVMQTWPMVLTARAIMSVVGLARAASISATTPRGKATAEVELGGLSGLHKLVPSWQGVVAQQEPARTDAERPRDMDGECGYDRHGRVSRTYTRGSDDSW